MKQGSTSLYIHADSTQTNGQIPYGGKLSREKTFANFANKRAFAKFFFAKSQNGDATLRGWGG